jgi:hypothetical protein
MNETALCALAQKWRTDKFGHHNYTPYYHAMLAARRDRIKKVVELGIGWAGMRSQDPAYPKAASLFMWQEYFPNAWIVGLDIRADTLVIEGRIQSFLCDQSSQISLEETAHRIGDDIDLFIDDGSHVPYDQALTAKIFWPRMADDGIYVIEDVYTAEQLRDVQNGLYDLNLPYQILKLENARLPDDRLIVIAKEKVHATGVLER